MFFADLLFAFFLALIFAGILAATGRSGPGPASGFLFFFLILLLASWAGGAWMAPAGPVFYGVAWLNFLLVAVAVFFLLGALIPRRPYRLTPPPSPEGESPTPEEMALATTFSVFFWFLVIFLGAVIVAAYL